MAQLGYTWYPKDWFTSNTRKRLKRFPLVRYAMRELYDLMYMESAPIEMNREYLIDDLDIELSDEEYSKLMEYVEITTDGRWWISSIKRRISKAETARENGKKGGRPKTQKPSETTQGDNPKNPPSERESKREIESKIEIEREGVFLVQEDFEITDLKNYMDENFKLRIPNWQKLYPNIGLTAVCESFQLENGGKDYTDNNHLRNAINQHWKFLNERLKKTVKETRSKNAHLFSA